MNLASLKKRVVAHVIDALILIICVAILRSISFLFLNITLTIILELCGFILIFVYFIIAEKKYGRTIGKKWLRLRVTNIETKKNITWKQSIIRNLLRIVDGLPILYLVGIILILTTKQKQRLGDLTAKTVVIQE